MQDISAFWFFKERKEKRRSRLPLHEDDKDEKEEDNDLYDDNKSDGQLETID